MKQISTDFIGYYKSLLLIIDSYRLLSIIITFYHRGCDLLAHWLSQLA